MSSGYTPSEDEVERIRAALEQDWGEPVTTDDAREAYRRFISLVEVMTEMVENMSPEEQALFMDDSL